jgi:hypothetical protein
MVKTQSSQSSQSLPVDVRLAERIVLNYWFELGIAFAIVANIVFMGVQVQYTAYRKTDKMPVIFILVDLAFTPIFTVELVLRLIHEGRNFFLFRQSSVFLNYLDVIIVASSLFEFVADVLFLMHGHTFGEGAESGSVGVVRFVRVAKLLRVIRIARIGRFMLAFRSLIIATVATLNSLAWAMLLLFLVIYAFGIIYTQRATDLIMDLRRSDQEGIIDPDRQRNVDLIIQYWGSLSASMFTLYKAIAQGISWEVALIPFEVLDGGRFEALVFLVYVSFTYFAVLNVLTASFCQSAIQAAGEKREIVVQNQLDFKRNQLKHIGEIFEQMDVNQSGIIRLDQFEEAMETDETQALLESIGVNFSDAWFLFKQLDINEDNKLGAKEFVDGIMQLKGEAKRIDLLSIEKRMDKILKTTSELLVRSKAAWTSDSDIPNPSSGDYEHDNYEDYYF